MRKNILCLFLILSISICQAANSAQYEESEHLSQALKEMANYVDETPLKLESDLIINKPEDVIYPVQDTATDNLQDPILPEQIINDSQTGTAVPTEFSLDRLAELRQIFLADQQNLSAQLDLTEEYIKALENKVFDLNLSIKEFAGNLFFHVRGIESKIKATDNKELIERWQNLRLRLTNFLRSLKKEQDRKEFLALARFLQESEGDIAKNETKMAKTDTSHTSFLKLKNAAISARKQLLNVSGAGYRTVVLTANKNGAAGDGRIWPSSKKYQRQSLNNLQKAIDAGDLLPGMVIYVNNSPGSDPSSTNSAYKPHWLTYLGKDSSGKPRFSNQYSTDRKIDELINFLPGRLIDEILDPYKKLR
jgi:hypothetical protein